MLTGCLFVNKVLNFIVVAFDDSCAGHRVDVQAVFTSFGHHELTAVDSLPSAELSYFFNCAGFQVESRDGVVEGLIGKVIILHGFRQRLQKPVVVVV